MFRVPLQRNSPIAICIEILEGLHARAQLTRGHDDRELQMAACYFLAQNASARDERAIVALQAKLTDDRAVREYTHDNEHGTMGSDFYVSACAADALAALSSINVDAVRTNNYEGSGFWSPRRLCVEGDNLILSHQRIFSDSRDEGAAPVSLMREDRDVCANCGVRAPKRWYATCQHCGKPISIKTVRVQHGAVPEAHQ